MCRHTRVQIKHPHIIDNQIAHLTTEYEELTVEVWRKRPLSPGELSTTLVQYRVTGMQEALVSWTRC